MAFKFVTVLNKRLERHVHLWFSWFGATSGNSGAVGEPALSTISMNGFSKGTALFSAAVGFLSLYLPVASTIWQRLWLYHMRALLRRARSANALSNGDKFRQRKQASILRDILTLANGSHVVTCRDVLLDPEYRDDFDNFCQQVNALITNSSMSAVELVWLLYRDSTAGQEEEPFLLGEIFATARDLFDETDRTTQNLLKETLRRKFNESLEVSNLSANFNQPVSPESQVNALELLSQAACFDQRLCHFLEANGFADRGSIKRAKKTWYHFPTDRFPSEFRFFTGVVGLSVWLGLLGAAIAPFVAAYLAENFGITSLSLLGMTLNPLVLGGCIGVMVGALISFSVTVVYHQLMMRKRHQLLQNFDESKGQKKIEQVVKDKKNKSDRIHSYEYPIMAQLFPAIFVGATLGWSIGFILSYGHVTAWSALTIAAITGNLFVILFVASSLLVRHSDGVKRFLRLSSSKQQGDLELQEDSEKQEVLDVFTWRNMDGLGTGWLNRLNTLLFGVYMFAPVMTSVTLASTLLIVSVLVMLIPWLLEGYIEQRVAKEAKRKGVIELPASGNIQKPRAVGSLNSLNFYIRFALGAAVGMYGLAMPLSQLGLLTYGGSGMVAVALGVVFISLVTPAVSELLGVKNYIGFRRYDPDKDIKLDWHIRATMAVFASGVAVMFIPSALPYAGIVSASITLSMVTMALAYTYVYSVWKLLGEWLAPAETRAETGPSSHPSKSNQPQPKQSQVLEPLLSGQQNQLPSQSELDQSESKSQPQSQHMSHADKLKLEDDYSRALFWNDPFAWGEVFLKGQSVGVPVEEARRFIELQNSNLKL